MIQKLELVLDDERSTVAAWSDGDRILVPVHAFAAVVGAEVKQLPAGGPLAVCRGDLCIPLDGDTAEVAGSLLMPLSTVAEPLGLKWDTSNGKLLIRSGQSGSEATGYGVGDVPPDIRLPDLTTGERVALSDFRGKKAVFYVWASW